MTDMTQKPVDPMVPSVSDAPAAPPADDSAAVSSSTGTNMPVTEEKKEETVTTEAGMMDKTDGDNSSMPPTATA